MDEKELLKAIQKMFDNQTKELKAYVDEAISKNNLEIAKLFEETIDIANNQTKQDIQTIKAMTLQNTYNIAKLETKVG